MNITASKTYPSIKGTRLLTGHMAEMQQDTYGFYKRHHAEHGDNLKFDTFFGMNFYSFASPEAMHHILIKARKKYSRGRRWSHVVSFIGGNGIITSKGELWQQQRQRITPYFQPAHIEQYLGTVAQNAADMAKRWQELPTGADINVSREMMKLGLVNISDILFNYDMRERAEDFSAAMMDGFTYINRFIQDPLTPPRFLPTKSNRNFKKNKAVADDIVREIVAVVRKDDEDCLINALVKAGNSDRQLHDEIITLLMAGHDTVSTALAWSWLLLSKHPEALEKAQEEIDRELQGATPTAESLERLPYTRMIFKETLRLYPSAWAIHRFAEEPDEVDGLPVRKWSSVVLPVYVTHRHPAHWKHPDRFWPEHFSKEESDGRARFAFIPFGGGEHVCPGAHLANTEGALILAALLQKVTPAMKDEAEISPLVSFTLKPERDIVGRAVARN